MAPLKELLIKRTEGNPFFVEEIVRSLAEAKVVVGAKGAYRPGLRIDGIRLPSTVRTVLADRVDRLPQVEKQLLQTAVRHRRGRGHAFVAIGHRIAGERTAPIFG